MNADELNNHLEIYLAVRSAIGFKDRALKILLKDFVKYAITNNAFQPIRARVAVDWACISSATRGTSGQSYRLSAARRFLTYLQASAPDIEVPDKCLVASAKRQRPYIFTKLEIVNLLEAASAIRPCSTLRPYTYMTVIGLMASTGLRVSEAIKLTVTDVFLNIHPARVCVNETKFYKSRIVPIHPSTAKQLRRYKKLRLKMGYAGLSDAFFVSEQGKHLEYESLRKWFNRATRRLEMHPVGKGRAPTLNSLRHTFAVERLTEWSKQGMSVQELVPNLSVYLGHVRPEDSYWYLTATPALLLTASELFRSYINQGDQQ